MDIRSESRISHPQEQVYLAYRNKLHEMSVYMSDVREIIVHSREERSGGVSLHNEWVSSRDVPRFLKRIIKPEHLRWHDYAEWQDDGRYVDWRTQTGAFREAVSCSGRTSFHADGDHTRVVVTGDLDIDLSKIRGIPRIGASALKPRIEKFIVGLLTPNLEKVNQCLQQYLDEHG